jgi:hypothetical protein
MGRDCRCDPGKDYALGRRHATEEAAGIRGEAKTQFSDSAREAVDSAGSFHSALCNRIRSNQVIETIDPDRLHFDVFEIKEDN